MLMQGRERAAVVDLAAIRHNVRVLRERVAPAEFMAVVKADAYGHGAVPVARAALEGGATWLGLAHVTEALALRAAGISAPALAWLHTAQTPFAEAIAQQVDLGVSGWELEPIAAAARAQGRRARVHLKADTGLGRNGATAQEWPGLCARARRLEQEGVLDVVGIFSHLAVADEPDRAQETFAQIEAFDQALTVARSAGLSPTVRHLANTPASVDLPQTRMDLVRVGLGIYGLSPFADRTGLDLGLRPAMSLCTTVSSVKAVPADQGISYGYRYRTAEPTTLALVPLGYADGVPRVAEDAPVWIDGVRHRVSGRIAMDQFVVDLGTAASDVRPGAEVELFGPRSGITAGEWAEAAGTINYEIVTRIGERVPRLYVDSDAQEVNVGEGGQS